MGLFTHLRNQLQRCSSSQKKKKKPLSSNSGLSEKGAWIIVLLISLAWFLLAAFTVIAGTIFKKG